MGVGEGGGGVGVGGTGVGVGVMVGGTGVGLGVIGVGVAVGARVGVRVVVAVGMMASAIVCGTSANTHKAAHAIKNTMPTMATARRLGRYGSGGVETRANVSSAFFVAAWRDWCAR